MARATNLEKENLEAHVDLCAQRYNVLEGRLSKIEEKVEHIHADMHTYTHRHTHTYMQALSGGGTAGLGGGGVWAHILLPPLLGRAPSAATRVRPWPL